MTNPTSNLLELEVIEYTSVKNRPHVHLFCRNDKGERIHKSFTYRPYFFLKESDASEERLRTTKSVLRVDKEGYKSLFDDILYKIILNLPMNIKLARDSLHKQGIPTFEADVYAFTLRWMIDNGIYYSWPPIPLEYPATIYVEDRAVRLFFDVEIPNDEIVMITYSTGDFPVHTLTSKCFAKTQPNTTCFTSEKEMLLAFLDIYLKIDADIIIGWNVSFDVKALIKRLKANKIYSRMLSPMNQISFSKIREHEVTIKGREVFDLARAYKERYKKELRVPIIEALDIVAKRHLGYGKLPLDYEDMPEVWEKNPNYFVEYNKRDVELLLKLEKKLKIVSFFNGLRKKTGVRLRDVWYKSRLVDAGLLRLSDRKLISAKALFSGEETYRGAIREVKPGIYDNFLLIDFRRFYANIVIKYNISPETLSPDGELIIDKEHRFRAKPEGLMPKLIKKLLKEQNLAKKRLKEDPSEFNEVDYKALKFLTLSATGIMGYRNSRMYNIKCAEAFTKEARFQIVSLKELLNKAGFDVKFLDTDSLGFPLTEYTAQKARERLINTINRNLAGLEVEEDKFFDRAIVVTKTRYIGKTEEGEIITKGLPTVRSDSPVYFANALEKLTELILNRKSKEEILAFLCNRFQELPKQDIIMLATPKGLKKGKFEEYKVDAYHVKASRRAENVLGLKFNIGDKPRILPTKDRERYIAIRRKTILPKNIRVDYKKLEKGLIGVLKPVYKLLGITNDEVLGLPIQASLKSFL